jgi:hypothetical protein
MLELIDAFRNAAAIGFLDEHPVRIEGSETSLGKNAVVLEVALIDRKALVIVDHEKKRLLLSVEMERVVSFHSGPRLIVARKDSLIARVSDARRLRGLAAEKNPDEILDVARQLLAATRRETEMATPESFAIAYLILTEEMTANVGPPPRKIRCATATPVETLGLDDRDSDPRAPLIRHCEPRSCLHLIDSKDRIEIGKMTIEAFVEETLEKLSPSAHQRVEAEALLAEVAIERIADRAIKNQAWAKWRPASAKTSHSERNATIAPQ